MKFPSVAIAFEAVFFRTFPEYEWQILLRNIILATENMHSEKVSGEALA